MARVICNLIIVIVAICLIRKAYNDGYQDGYNQLPKWSRQWAETKAYTSQQWENFNKWMGPANEEQRQQQYTSPWSGMPRR